MESNVIPIGSSPFELAREAKAKEVYEEYARVYRSVSPEIRLYARTALAEGHSKGLEGEDLSKIVWQTRENLESSLNPADRSPKREAGRMAELLSRMDLATVVKIMTWQADQAHGVVSDDVQTLALKTDQDLLNLPPMDWIIEGILPEKSMVVVYGPPKQYKSFIVQAMAWAISSGCNWMGYPTVQSPVLYIAGEGEWGMKKRYAAWRIKNGIPLDASFPFFSYGRSINLADDRQVDMLIRSVPPETKLIVLDTLNRCMEGDENSAADVRAFVSGCDRVKEETGATIVIVHHSGKDAKKGMRGSSALLGAVDVAISVQKDDTNEEFVTVRCADMKDFEEFSPISLRAEEIQVNEEETALVFGFTEYRVGDRKPPQAPQSAEKILIALQKAKEPVRPKDIPELAGVSLSAWDKYRRTLLEQGKIRKEGVGYVAENLEE